MTRSAHPERETQNRIIQFFQKELGYTISEICSEYLGENRDFVFWYPDINEILESLKDFNLDE